MTKALALIAAASLLTLATATQAADAGPDYGLIHDLAILNGQVVDGQGGPAVRADVVVDGDQIVFVGAADHARLHATKIVDADGKVVSPGFIDTHTHGDVLSGTSFENFVAQGVTTIVLGQDGETPGSVDATPRPFGAWLEAVDHHPLDVNVAALIGHGTLRELAGMPGRETPTEANFARMDSLLEDGMKAGAFGMSSGLEYVPGVYSDTAELVRLAKVVGRYDGVVMSHMRTEDTGKIEGAIDELIAQGRYARVHVSHIKVVLGKQPQEARAVLAQMQAARDRGMTITADVYPYLAGFNDMVLLYPPWVNSKEEFAEAVAHRRPELEAYLRDRMNLRNGPGALLIASAPYTGKTLEQIATEKNKPFTDVLIDDFGYGGPVAAHFIMNQAIQDVFILDPNIGNASDGGPTIRHPRSYGTFAKIIQDYVVGQPRMPIELAVHKMAAVAAGAVGLHDRGMIKAGMKADIDVFDPAAVRVMATWEKPLELARGFDLVVINGRVVREGGAATAIKAGRLLRRTGPGKPQ